MAIEYLIPGRLARGNAQFLQSDGSVRLQKGVFGSSVQKRNTKKPSSLHFCINDGFVLERPTRLELATSTLARDVYKRQSEECPIHENYKAALLKAKDSDTIVTGRSVGAPVRVLKNRMSREYVRQEKAGADKMERKNTPSAACARPCLKATPPPAA